MILSILGHDLPLSLWCEISVDTPSTNMMCMRDVILSVFEEERKQARSLVEGHRRKIRLIEKNQTWKLVEHPKYSKVNGLKWIYKTKLSSHQTIQTYKTRIMAKRYSQNGVYFCYYGDGGLVHWNSFLLHEKHRVLMVSVYVGSNSQIMHDPRF